ncbi:hypothetical protein [Streptomyces millisiae]|uniref:Uncharacterized protein n=1 Tax=Streptomyces millisiae TaxID=3075542 RepID=A0ABU2LZZ4_9ACTN|nr:hypothetical protein [Streptomyces sp. DSM 44918]MDT0323169.1 hypothetical protein [Streptomyces sp. DSM 44918]
MTTSERLDMPARRRRHARLIATLTQLIGDCAAAAGEVYGPIADAPPEQAGVAVSRRAIAELSVSASIRLDDARAEDATRWPTVVAQEEADSRRTFAARCVTAELEQVLNDVGFGAGDHPQPLDAEALVTAPQSAAMRRAGVGGDFLVALLEDPEQAVIWVRGVAASGEFTVDQILDEAVDTAMLSGLISLRKAQSEADPSTAAEGCLAASRHFALAVSVASADLEEAMS